MFNEKKHGAGSAVKIILSVLLVVLTLGTLAATGAGIVCGAVLNGPSETARDQLTVRLLESESTAWIPTLFLDAQTLAQIPGSQPVLTPEELPAAPSEQIRFDQAPADPWAAYPDGIRIETYHSRTFTAQVMLIKDPSQVYLGTSSRKFDLSITGNRILTQMKKEGALAAINAGAFNDDGSAGTHVGSLPMGMVISNGEILWDDGKSYDGFVGLTQDNVLVVADTIDRDAVAQMKIRDGCCFGPVLVKDGIPNEGVYVSDTSYNARTAIGQRADGTIIFLCIDGRQAGSLGATFPDVMEAMVDLGAVNACNLDGGASTVMAYRDCYGRYGKAGEVVLCGNYALIQASARRMPTFFMVRLAETEE